MAILGTAAMLLGGFLPWIDLRFGLQLEPFEALGRAWRDAGIELPREMAVLGASFILAGLALVMALVGRLHRGLTFFAGALPWGYFAWQIWRADDRLGQFGLSVVDLRGGTDEVWAAIREVALPGFYLYWAGAAMVIIAALLAFLIGERRA